MESYKGTELFNITLEDASVSDTILTSPDAFPLSGLHIYIFYELLL